MKCFEFEIENNYINTFFPKKRIKNKTEILEILLEACRYMIIRKPQKNIKCDNKIVIFIDKMSRIFFYNKNKYYSISFPFYISCEENILKFNYNNLIDVNSETISHFISYLKSNDINNTCVLDFADSIENIENNIKNFWTLLKDLLFNEDGYIRFDNDPTGYKEAKYKSKEHCHPENHYDLFYSNRSSFKIGLYNKILQEDFIDTLNVKTDCKYLKPYN